MERIRRCIFSGAGLVGMVAMWLITTGCEKADLNGENALVVTPGETTLSSVNQIVTLTVSAAATNTRPIIQPLSWSVSDDSLGDIVSAAGLTAVYLSSQKAGNNIITVRDQQDAVGIAVVVQDVEDANSLTVSPASITMSNANQMVTFRVTASGGYSMVEPLSWSVANSGLGEIVSTTGATAVYISTSRQGNNIITVRDSADAAGVATVAQNW